mgnify:CR=1 FL=1
MRLDTPARAKQNKQAHHGRDELGTRQQWNGNSTTHAGWVAASEFRQNYTIMYAVANGFKL